MRAPRDISWFVSRLPDERFCPAGLGDLVQYLFGTGKTPDAHQMAAGSLRTDRIRIRSGFTLLRRSSIYGVSLNHTDYWNRSLFFVLPYPDAVKSCLWKER